MTRTYADSGILIAAARGKEKHKLHDRAQAILNDPKRDFVCSDYVRLEVIPKPTFFKNVAEVAFYEFYFSTVAPGNWVAFDGDHLRQAFEEACRSGLSAIDAIHVVVAAISECDELVTTEKIGTGIHRTDLIRIVSIDP